jgi:sporulation and spore germination protein
MSRRLKLALAVLLVAVVAGAIYLRSLHRRVLRIAQNQTSEEQARREVVEPPISTPTDVQVKAKIFWASAVKPALLEPVDVEMPLSADFVLRSKQLLRVLIANVPEPEQRTLPADTTLLDFYILPDGTAIADFSDTLSSETPSGILSEQMAIDSIARTLEANVLTLRRLKILIHGQEAETLAGHLDLTGFFDLHPPASATAASPAPPGSQTLAVPSATGGLTAPASPGKLKP